MGRPRRPKEHVTELPSGQLSKALLYPVSPILEAMVRSLNKMSSSTHPHIFLAHYPYGYSIAEWAPEKGGDSQFHAPCRKKDIQCSGCRQMLSMCSDGPPILIALQNAAEIYKDMAAAAKISKQAPSVPIRFLFPGQSFG